MVGYEGDDDPSFEKLLKEEIQTLRKQLDKEAIENPSSADELPVSSNNFTPNGIPCELQKQHEYVRNIDSYIPRISPQRVLQRIYTIASPAHIPGGTPPGHGRCYQMS